MMESAQPAIRIYGTRGSAACYSIRDFLHRSDIPFQWIDLTTDEQASTEARVSGIDDARLPICVFPDGARPLKRVIQRELQNPLAEKILAGEIRDGDTVRVTASPLGLLLQPVTRHENLEAERRAAQ